MESISKIVLIPRQVSWFPDPVWCAAGHKDLATNPKNEKRSSRTTEERISKIISAETQTTTVVTPVEERRPKTTTVVKPVVGGERRAVDMETISAAEVLSCQESLEENEAGTVGGAGGAVGTRPGNRDGRSGGGGSEDEDLDEVSVLNKVLSGVKKESLPRCHHKSTAVPQKKVNRYFQKIRTCQTTGAPCFCYKGKMYVGTKTQSGMLVFKREETFFGLIASARPATILQKLIATLLAASILTFLVVTIRDTFWYVRILGVLLYSIVHVGWQESLHGLYRGEFEVKLEQWQLFWGSVVSMALGLDSAGILSMFWAFARGIDVVRRAGTMRRLNNATMGDIILPQVLLLLFLMFRTEILKLFPIGFGYPWWTFFGFVFSARLCWIRDRHYGTILPPFLLRALWRFDMFLTSETLVWWPQRGMFCVFWSQQIFGDRGRWWFNEWYRRAPAAPAGPDRLLRLVPTPLRQESHPIWGRRRVGPDGEALDLQVFEW